MFTILIGNKLIRKSNGIAIMGHKLSQPMIPTNRNRSRKKNYWESKHGEWQSLTKNAIFRYVILMSLHKVVFLRNRVRKYTIDLRLCDVLCLPCASVDCKLNNRRITRGLLLKNRRFQRIIIERATLNKTRKFEIVHATLCIQNLKRRLMCRQAINFLTMLYLLARPASASMTESFNVIIIDFKKFHALNIK